MESTASTTAEVPVYKLWMITSFFAFFQFFLQTAAGVVGLEWMHDFHLDKIGLSQLSSAFYYTYALLQIPAGILFDRYPPRNILLISTLTLAIGTTLLACTHQYEVAYFARLMMGAGSSFGFVGLMSVCARNFPPQRFALMLGLSEGLTMFLVMIGVMLLTTFMTYYSWRVAIFGSGMVTFLTTLAVFLFVNQDNVYKNEDSEQTLTFQTIIKRLKIIITNRQVILCSIYSFFMFSIVSAFTSLWGVAFLMRTSNFTKETAASMIAIVFVGIALGGPLSGWLSKIVNKNRPILIIAALGATCLMNIIVFWPGIPSGLMFVLFFFSGMFCAAYVQSFAVIKDSVHPSIRATALATVNMVVMLGAPILQLLIGWLLQNQFFGWTTHTATVYRLSLAILPLGMLISFLLALKIRES